MVCRMQMKQLYDRGKGAHYSENPRESAFYLVGKSRKLPLISPVKDYSDSAIRSPRERGRREGQGRESRGEGRRNSRGTPTQFPPRFRAVSGNRAANRSFNSLPSTGITALSARVFWICLSYGPRAVRVRRLIFLFDGESAFRKLFARPRRSTAA